MMLRVTVSGGGIVVMTINVMLRVTEVSRPGHADDGGGYEHSKKPARAQDHRRLEDEAEVEVDSVEEGQALEARLSGQPAVLDEVAADEVEAEEHHHGQGGVDWNPHGAMSKTFCLDQSGPAVHVVLPPGYRVLEADNALGEK